MKTRTETILTVMHVLAWIGFIGLAIEAGAILTAYGVSWFNPIAAKDLYRGMNLYDLSQYDFWLYTQMVSYIVALVAIKAYAVYLVIKIMMKVKLQSPFTAETVTRLETISYVLFGGVIISILCNVQTGWLSKRVQDFNISWIGDNAGEFLFMAGLVFVISQVFKRGVELQSENELTV
ncbi:MAG: DUF2975 domain-containing protein [Cyclobacteriaceae bacterium]|nr:DUF2975 domain-containing protein [Cyclobacteriaceae bacterium]